MYSTHLSGRVELLNPRVGSLELGITADSSVAGSTRTASILDIVITIKLPRPRLVFWLNRLWSLSWIMTLLITVSTDHLAHVLGWAIAVFIQGLKGIDSNSLGGSFKLLFLGIVLGTIMVVLFFLFLDLRYLRCRGLSVCLPSFLCPWFRVLNPRIFQGPIWPLTFSSSRQVSCRHC